MAGAIGLATMAFAAPAAASEYLMISGSGFGSRGVMLFDPNDGTPVDPGNYYFEEPDVSGILKHAMQVDDEIWLTAQAAGQIRRYDLDGNFLSTITQAGPDGEVIGNNRGMTLHNGTVYLTNAAGTPGNAIVTYDTDGNWQQTQQIAGSPFSVLPYNGELLVGHLGSEDIQSFDFDLNPLGPFHQGDISWVQQMNENSEGNLLATGWSSNGVYEFDADGNLVGSFAADSPRGVWELDNGNVLWTNSSGVHVYDVDSGMNIEVLSGFNAQYIDRLVLPAPGAFALLGLAGLVGHRRRRR